MAALGIALVLWLLMVVLIESIRKGLPAISSGQLVVIGIPKIKNISQATSIFGFAFYIQPIMMPYLSEVPSGKVGISILKWSTRIVVLGISFVTYAIIGLFGAARYGAQTSDNILENKWMGGGIGQGILNLSIALYLALSVPMIEFPIRHTVSCWFPETKKSLLRRLSTSAVIMLLSLLIALIFPNNSGNVLVVTGAVGVCIVSYLVPITNHFCLLLKRVKLKGNSQVQQNGFEPSNLPRHGDSEMQEDGTPMDFSNASLHYRLKKKDGVLNMIIEIVWEYFVPILVIVIGLFCSIMALSTL